ncbi:MAG: phasin family protein [Actinomycetota bacterium]
MLDDLRRWALFGSGVAELTKSRAEQIVKELVSAGDVRRKQASGLVKELLEASRDNRKELIRLLRSEVQTQIEAVGLATKRDMERLDRRVKRLEDNMKATRKKTTRTKSSAKKSTSKSGGAGRSPKKEG